MNDLPLPTAHDLLARWDAQQTAYIKHRDQRFAIMAETIARHCGDSPRILDLACGPSSTSAALLKLLPGAQIVAVDKDPVLLAIATESFAGRDNVEVHDEDLDQTAWLEAIGGQFDAVVSSTALHWLAPDALARLYFTLSSKVREGGIFLNADHLKYDDVTQPVLHRISAEDDKNNQKIAFDSGVDTWDAWWDAVKANPAYQDAVARRDIVWEGKGPQPHVSLGYHLTTLRSAGFRETGTIWQYFDDYVLYAVR
ncbi:class I SAM-dependent methyltransferase [Pelagibacterium limicola]|uniref:class I SAM-dependent methyltransferase n=1 Tax=Pelagibacterium limicola TaxID=2791022 RepID=UPI0018AFBE80|nr:class I SAM-dependent methyltransferase [Pelagibacterium limicola]